MMTTAGSSTTTDTIFLTECPRDAMQGWKEPITTEDKIRYLNALLRVGYHVLDAGSYVSPKAIPQMADTDEVLSALDRSQSSTQLSVIVANVQGAERALQNSNADILAFPFSISEQFQLRNTHKGRTQAVGEIKEIYASLKETDRSLWIYFSMAFGNPYGEEWDVDIVKSYVEEFGNLGIRHILISDTTGIASPQGIEEMFGILHREFPEMVFSAHFHNQIHESYAKLKAAWKGGCRRFDSAIKGIGGCPFAKDELTGNMPTEQVINFMAYEKIKNPLRMLEYESAYNIAKDIFKF